MSVPHSDTAPSREGRANGHRGARSADAGVRFPVATLSVSTALSVLLLALLALFLWRSLKDFESFQARELRLQEASGVIRQLDEVLTMSALQAASTGDTAWEDRYRRFEPVLDAAIKNAERLAPEAFESRAAELTDAANARLVVMEHRAFDLVREGRRDEATSLLSSAEYRNQKRIYAEGIRQVASAIEQRVALAVQAQRRRALLALVSIVIGMSVTVGAWALAISALRRYMAEHAREESLRAAIYEISEAAHQAESLDQLFLRIHTIVGRLMEARNLYIALWNRDEDLITFPYFQDEADDTPAPRPPGRGLTEYVLRTGKPLLATPEVFEQLCARGEAVSMGAPSLDWLGVPLMVGERMLGALVVQSYSGEVRYGEREKEILTFVSRQVALAIERKRTEGVLRASEERYRLVLQRLPVGVFHYDTDLRITDCNDRFVEILRSSRKKLVGLDMNRLNDRRVIPAIRQAVRGEHGEYVGPYEGTTGPARLHVSMRTAPLHGARGRVIGGVGIVEDNTDQHRLEEQLLQSQKMEAVGTLAGGVAHDFNNLLQAMFTQTQLLQSLSDDPAEVRTAARELEQQIGRGAWLTRQLLVFSRRETASHERIDLNDAVRDATQMLRRLVPANIVLEIDLAESTLPVEADPGQLHQVLVNLTLNAVHAMPGGGRLAVRTCESDGREVWVEVEDNGHGIPEAIRDRIFEPFFTTKELGKGTGLGLSVVHAIVTGCGGRVDVETEVGKGSTFRMVLPRAAPGGVVESRAAEPPAADLTRGAGERILVVEDEDAARDGLQQILASLGYDVTAVATGADAAELAADRPFDLLLTDLMLPGVMGNVLAEELHARWPALKVILMSGYSEDEAVRRAVSAGGVRFLQKPFDMATLARAVRDELRSG
ncbi:MAG TPA: ATP-binding protein [Thermoanaerobaculaceae bacterium]|nr:ATP-binding protein [Thermoanaerobaculaceae bacterium]